VFALGVLLYELLTGSHPFGPIPVELAPEKLASLLVERQQSGCMPLRVPGLYRGAAGLIERCLAFDPGARPASAAELAKGLRAAFPSAGRWPWLLAAAFVLLLGGAAWLRLAEPAAGDYTLGQQTFHAGLYPEAERHFSRALAADPADLNCRFALSCARMRRSLDERGEVQRDLLAAASSDFTWVANREGSATPRQWIAWECAAYCNARRDDHKMAVHKAVLAFEAGDRSTALLNNRAVSHMALAQFDDAKRDLAAIDPGEGTRPEVCCNRAMLAFMQRATGKVARVPAEALEEMRTALRAGGDWTLSLAATHLFAFAAEDVGRETAAGERLIHEALACLRTALELGMEPSTLDYDPFCLSQKGRPEFEALRKLPKATPVATRPYQLIDPIGDLPE
jgi:hypothetical protein